MEKGLCAALGDFDGVHLGHAEVIKSAVQYCGDLTPSVYTFTDNCKHAPILTDNITKESVFRSFGIKKIIFDDFEKIEDLSPLSFVRDILFDKYGIKSIVCGEDYRFGKNAEGDVELLKDICYNFNIDVKSVNCLYKNSKKISSSFIRQCIANGNMEAASQLLGRYFCINGYVERGKSIGHTHNAPTVNISFQKNSIIPAYGVYITQTHIDGESYNSISNVGVRPSVETTDIPNIETNIFDFDRDIYNKNIKICFIKMLRPEIKFSSADNLFDQIQKDIITAKGFFNGEINE